MKKKSRIISISISMVMLLYTISFAFFTNTVVVASESVFAKGADVGWLPQMEASGTIFKDDSGVQKDCLQILKEHGVDSIRLRAWVNPSNDLHAGHCSTSEVVYMAKRAADMGFRIMIDLHYSDSWADPSKQVTPAGWSTTDLNILKGQVSTYTSGVMQALKDAGVTPEWVQIGNEINPGMMLPLGSITTPSNLVQLIQAGSSAAKLVFPQIKVVIHTANGGSADFVKFYDTLTAAGLKSEDYDVIGMSYYPGNSYTTSINTLASNMNALATKFNKEVMVVEIGGDCSADEYNVYNAIVDVIAKLKAVPNNLGAGVFYWEPEGMKAWSGYSMSAWNDDGTPSIPMDAFKTGASILEPYPVQSIVFPNPTLSIELWSNSTMTVNVTPTNATFSQVRFTSSDSSVVTVGEYTGAIYGKKVGTATITATTYDGKHTASCEVTVNKGNVLIQNSGFETNFEGWTVENTTGSDITSISSEYSHTGTNMLHYYKGSAAEFTVSQNVYLDNGTYRLSAYAEGGGGEDISEFFANSASGNLSTKFTNDGWKNWNKYTIDNIQVTDGMLTIGAHIKLNSGNWGNIDDFELSKVQNNQLTDLKVNGSTISGFDPLVQSYNVMVPYGTTQVPTVTATAPDGATANITSATSLPGQTTVAVSSGGETKTYIVNFTVDPNPIVNYGFENGYTENGPTGWNVSDISAWSMSNDKCSGAKALGFWKKDAFTLDANQTLTGLPNGIYSLSAYSQGGGDENTNQIYAVNGNNEKMTANFANKGWAKWNQAVISNIKVTDEKLKIGLFLDANSGDWGSYDDFNLVKTGELNNAVDVTPTPVPEVTPTPTSTATPVPEVTPTPTPTTTSVPEVTSTTTQTAALVPEVTPTPSAVTNQLDNVKEVLKDLDIKDSVKLEAAKEAVKEALDAACIKPTVSTGSAGAILSVSTGDVKKAIDAVINVSNQVSSSAVKDDIKVDNKITITAPSSVTDNNILASISADSAKLLIDNKIDKVEVQSASGSVLVPVGLLASGKDFSVKVNSISLSDVQGASRNIGSSAGTTAQALAAFDYQLNVGGERISKFTTPVQLSMKLDSANIKPGITAVYYLDDNNKLNFIGGKCSAGEITVDVTHFSKYVAMNLTKTFSDLSNDYWLNNPTNNYLAKGVARLIANGDSNGHFNPENTITRAEFAAFIARTLNLDTKDYEGLFADVKADAWYAKEVEAVKRAGLIDGIGNSNFAPDKAITREEMAKMIMAAYTKITGKSSDDLIGGTSSSFTDINDVHNWAQKYVAGLEKLGIVSGYDGNYKPLENSTRAQSLKVIVELAEKAGV